MILAVTDFAFFVWKTLIPPTEPMTFIYCLRAEPEQLGARPLKLIACFARD